MSRAFVKDADETFDELPARPIRCNSLIAGEASTWLPFGQPLVLARALGGPELWEITVSCPGVPTFFRY